MNNLFTLNTLTKIIFITHSDVAYSNYYIDKYHTLFHKIITVNNYTIHKLHTFLKINIDKFIKIINYTDIINYNIENTIKEKKYKFGVISRFSEDKNIPMFILSIIPIFKKYPKYKCYLVGTESEYYNEYLKYIIKINNLQNYILFEGYQENVVKYYEIFDFVILPSVSEGCSYNIIEAMSLGLPVICSNVGGNDELIKNDDNGVIYNYTSIRELEKKYIYIKNYNEQLSKIGYFINENTENNKFIFYNNFSKYDKIKAYIPYYLTCNSKCINKNCSLCDEIKLKSNIFTENINTITNSIFKMIELDNEHLAKIEKNNINFIKNNFTLNKYINQLLSII